MGVIVDLGEHGKVNLGFDVPEKSPAVPDEQNALSNKNPTKDSTAVETVNALRPTDAD